jgi:hypothetical protein
VTWYNTDTIFTTHEFIYKLIRHQLLPQQTSSIRIKYHSWKYFSLNKIPDKFILLESPNSESESEREKERWEEKGVDENVIFIWS